MSEPLQKTDRSRPRRMHERGRFDRETANAILDAMPMCHVGYLIDGKPIVMPTFQWREGNHVYWHASSAGRGVRNAEDNEVCLTVTILDGFVLARSGMHHSANYRSIMLFGKPTRVTDRDAKEAKLKNFVDGLFPGRWDTLRPINEQEAKATTILSLPIEEGSSKIRTGGAVDDEEDYELPIWAGVIPVSYSIGEVVPDERNLPGVAMPDHVKALKIG